MGFKAIPCKCQVCGKAFHAESYQVYLCRKNGRKPVCSRACEQERRHKASRDAKWVKLQAKIEGGSFTAQAEETKPDSGGQYEKN